MRAAIELDRLLAELKENGVPAPLRKRVEALYKLTYKEAYADGQSDCEERHDEAEEDRDARDDQ
jgi:hypothetical protein